MKVMENKSSARYKLRRGRLVAVKEQGAMWALLIPTILALLLCHWYPIFRGIATSFFHTKGFKIQEFVGLSNYKAVLTDTMFLQTLWNTVQYVVWSFLIGAIPPIAIAIAVNEVVHFKQGFKILTYLPAIAPGLAASIIWMNIFNPAPGGLFNQILSAMNLPISDWLLNEHLTIPLIVISMTWKGYAGTMLLYLASLQSISQDLYEAAVIDGAGIWKRIFNITIPHLAPTILLMSVNQIIGVFQIFDQPFVMTGGGPNNASLTLGLSSYKMAFTYMQVDRSMALATVSFIILLFATIFYFRLQKKFEE